MSQALPPRFIFLRHGRTAWNARRVVMGQEDIPLDAEGEAQAEAAARALAALPLTSVWCSPLLRCRATAAPLLRRRPELAETVVDGLRERHWGVFQGMSITARCARPETPEGGETFAAFDARALAALAAVRDEGLPLVVSHSGVFRSLLDHLGLDGEVTVPNAAPCRIEPGAAQPVRPLEAELLQSSVP